MDELSDEEFFARMTAHQMYEIVGLPAISLWNASKEDIQNENMRLRELLEQATFTMQRDYTLKKLMERENKHLWRRLYKKDNKPATKYDTSGERHLTSDKNLIKLGFHEWKVAIKGVFASEEFKALKKTPDEDEIWKRTEMEEREREKERKKAEQAEKKRQKQVEQDERKKEKEIRKIIKDAEKTEKERKSAEKKAAAAEKRDAAERKKAEAALRRQQRAGNEKGWGKQMRKNEDDGEDTLTNNEMPMSETNLDWPAILPQQDMEAHGNTPIRPKPCPRLRLQQEVNVDVLMAEMGPMRRSQRNW